MDWAKTKTMLIVAFAVLDLVLGVFWWRMRADTPFNLWGRPGGADPVRTQLASTGIILNRDLPEYPRKMQRLQVQPRPVDPAALAERFFGPQAGVNGEGVAGESGRVFQRGPEQLTILLDGRVYYERRDVTAGGLNPSFNRESARQTAESFLNERQLLPEDGVFDFAARIGVGRFASFQVYFSQWYREWPLFPGFLGVEVTGDTAGNPVVRLMGAYWLDVVGFSGNGLDIIPPEEALRALADYLTREKGWRESDRLLVDRVELGYYSRNEPDASTWEVDPFWRVLTSSGESYYVKAIHPVLVEE